MRTLTHYFLPADTFNRWLLAIFLGVWAISCINLPYPEYFELQHVPTVLFIVGLVFAERQLGVTRASFAMMISFMLLHVLGARYLYSFVPYDEWLGRLFGFRINDFFGFERNHYDRLVHFAFGLLFTLPFWEFLEKQLKLRAMWAAAGSICMVLAAGAVYEIAEWAVAMTFAPDWAESYNGQQGDPWDAQRDMTLAWLGSIICVVVISLVRKRA